MWQTSSIPRSANRRITRVLGFAFIAVVVLCFLNYGAFDTPKLELNYVPIPIRPERYPLSEPTIRLPRRPPHKIPKIQHLPKPESIAEKRVREERLQEIKNEFLHAWRGYKQEAWTHDELKPIEGGYKSPFCGWAASMVDALDTLWIMGLKDEFELTLVELRNIDFTNTGGCQVNLFETTIRHLGGLLSAFDVSGGKYSILVQKAVELAEILFTAFDTPNRMPTPHYVWSATDEYANAHLPSSQVVLAVLGSLSLEFTRLTQITGNEKYYDAVQRVINELEKWQNNSQLPGMWPAMVDSTKYNETVLLGSPYPGSDELFTLGALADSTYEYLPKQWMLLGGTIKSYRSMYVDFVETAKKFLFFRPMTVMEEDILIAGAVNVKGENAPRHTAELQHLSCFTGGMLAIAGKIFKRPEDVEDGRKLAAGCVWAYQNTVTGIMPETFTAVKCENRTSCKWNTKTWYNAIDRYAEEDIIRERIVANKLSPGFASIQDARYLLRPEAIESVFILYRITGDIKWANDGWAMFKSIMAQTKTRLAHSAIQDVLNPASTQLDEMESFWLAETLKYFYLLFSTFDVVSLDEYVLNTEAHPLRRPA